jgi:hypothetical protein
VKESELNVLAKMLNSDVEEKVVKIYADELKVSLKTIKDRAEEIKLLKETEKISTGNPLGLKMELQMDVLHRKLFSETTTTAQKQIIAEEIATIQAKLNASINDAYITPRSAFVQVTRKEARKEGLSVITSKPISSAMGYMDVLDQLSMLEITRIKIVKNGLVSETCKDLAKYAERLMSTSKEYGVDFAKAKGAKLLFDHVSELLAIARGDLSKLAEGKWSSYVTVAADKLEEHVIEWVSQMQKNAKKNEALKWAIGKLKKSMGVVAILLRKEAIKQEFEKKQ